MDDEGSMTAPDERATRLEVARDRYPDPDALDCIELVELVTEYFDGALEAGERARLERHLADCDGCTTYVEQFRETIRATGHLEPEGVAPDAIERLLRVYREFRAG